MFRKFNLLPLFLACFMIVGHAVFPHTHRDTQGDVFVCGLKEVTLNSPIFNFLHALFAQDLGDNHLENYHKAQHELPTFEYVAQVFLHTLLQFSLEAEDEDSSFYVYASPKPVVKFIVSDAPLRAPPSV